MPKHCSHCGHEIKADEVWSKSSRKVRYYVKVVDKGNIFIDDEVVVS